MTAHTLRRLAGLFAQAGRALTTPAPQGLDSLPAHIRRDVLADGLPPAARAPSPRNPRGLFSFHIHPASELTELRDRLSLATLPRIGDNPVRRA